MATTLARRDYLLRLLGNATPGTTNPVVDHLGRSIPSSTVDSLGRSVVAPAWIIATVYAAGALVTVTASNKVLRCTVGGTSHASTPPVAPGHGLTVTDNTVTWIQLN